MRRTAVEEKSLDYMNIRGIWMQRHGNEWTVVGDQAIRGMEAK